MKASVVKNNILIFIAFIIVQLFSIGCGGGGGGSKTSSAIYTVTGQVKLLDPTNKMVIDPEKITVRLEQQPTIFTSCDENGNFKLEFPKIDEKVNLIAFKGSINSENFYIQRSEDITLSNETSINAGELLLTSGVNTFLIEVYDEYFYPLKYAKCSFWGFDITSDYNGRIAFPKFPENIKKVKATISGYGVNTNKNTNVASIKEMTNEYSVFTKDLGPYYEVIVFYQHGNSAKSPVILDIEEYVQEPAPNQKLDFTLIVSDKSKILNSGKYKYQWYCTDGQFASTDSTELPKNSWIAPPYDCLATISVGIYSSNVQTRISFNVAVGKSRKPNSELETFVPSKAAAGQQLVLYGSGLGDTKGEVYVGGALAEVISWANMMIKVTVPDEAESGKIVIKTGGKTITSQDDFTCIDYSSKLSSSYGVPGTEITIAGYGYGNIKEENSDLLYDGEKVENILSWTNRSIKFKVEELTGGAPHTAKLDLIIRGRKRSLGDFSVTYIKNVSPLEANHYTYESEIEKTVITLTGDGFGEQDDSGKNSSVKFLTYGENNKEEFIDAEVKSWSDDEIEVYLPLKAQTGKIILNINGYEMTGPEITIIPASGYSEQISARFSDVLAVSNPLITGVIPKDSERVYLCDPQNYRLWYLDGDQYSYIPITNANKAYQPYTGVASGDSIILVDWEDKILVKLIDGSVAKTSSYVFTGAPMGVCVAKKSGLIYATDSGSNEIVIFNENLEKIDSFGEEGIENGYFTKPEGICLNTAETSIFVADSDNHRIQQFDISTDANGKKEYKFKCWYGSFNGENGKHTKESEFGESNNSKSGLGFIQPTAVACDGNYLYVTDSGRNDIQKINLTNLSCEVIGEEGNGNSQFMAPTDIKLLGSNLYVADSENSRIQIISKTGVFASQQKPDVAGMNVSFLGIAMNNDKDSLYIVDSFDCTISKFDVYGTFEKKIGSKGSGVGQLLNPSDVLLDKDDNIWVADTGNRRLVMFPSDGSEAKSFGSGGSGVGQFKSPQRLACDSKGNIFVSDCDNNSVLKFDKSGQYLYTIGQSELDQPFGLAVDSSDNLYICDAGHHRICRYDANNQFVGWFGLAEGQEAGGWHEASEGSKGSSGSAPCQFISPLYLDIDGYDALYVLDHGSKRIQKLDTKNTGTLGGHIDTVEVDAEMFGIAVDDKDCFFITTESFVRKYVPAP
ncbi:MAG: hypothetical protein II961_09820 [Candidatus Riflebacteria bacterium]|nr:hypothetical protein [Candidatus Riflebacteria bacterium]